jgi:hypothetical protein
VVERASRPLASFGPSPSAGSHRAGAGSADDFDRFFEHTADLGDSTDAAQRIEEIIDAVVDIPRTARPLSKG